MKDLAPIVVPPAATPDKAVQPQAKVSAPIVASLHAHLFYLRRSNFPGTSKPHWDPPRLSPQMTLSAPRMCLTNGFTTRRTTGNPLWFRPVDILPFGFMQSLSSVVMRSFSTLDIFCPIALETPLIILAIGEIPLDVPINHPEPR